MTKQTAHSRSEIKYRGIPAEKIAVIIEEAVKDKAFDHFFSLKNSNDGTHTVWVYFDSKRNL